MAKKAAQLTAGVGSEQGHEKGPLPRLHVKYKSEIVPVMMKEFGYTNAFSVPRVKVIVLNMGLGKHSEGGTNTKVIESAVQEVAAISGQRPMVTRSRKAIANFKLRADQPVGVTVTLRRALMWEFLDRFLNISLPRVRDFKGVPPRGFDGRGNYTLGIKEQIIFPEINYDRVDKIKGMNITIVTTARTDEEGRKLLGLLGMPFKK